MTTATGTDCALPPPELLELLPATAPWSSGSTPVNGSARTAPQPIRSRSGGVPEKRPHSPLQSREYAFQRRWPLLVPARYISPGSFCCLTALPCAYFHISKMGLGPDDA